MSLNALTLRPAATLSSSPSNLRTLPPITTDTGRKGGWESVKAAVGEWEEEEEEGEEEEERSRLCISISSSKATSVQR